MAIRESTPVSWDVSLESGRGEVQTPYSLRTASNKSAVEHRGLSGSFSEKI